MNRTHYCFLLLSFALLTSSCRRSAADTDMKIMEEVVAGLNRQVPIELDYMTVLDSLKILPDKTVGYYYTLRVNLVKTDTTVLKHVFRENTTYVFMNDSRLLALRERGIACRYVYFSPVGKLLLDFTLGPDFYLVQESDFQNNVSDDKIYAFLQQSARFYNAQMPREIESEVILTHVDVKYPKTLNYRYLIEGIKLEDVDFESFDVDGVRLLLADELRNDATVLLFKDNDVIFSYTYTDEDGIEIYTVEVLPEEYNKPPEKEKTEIRMAIDDWKKQREKDSISSRDITRL